MKEEFCAKINSILDRLIFANSSAHIISSIIQFIEDGNEAVLQSDINFWKLIMDNCSYRILAELAKIYDENSESIGLLYLLNYSNAKKDILFKSEDAETSLLSLKNEYEKISDLRIKLKIIRNKGLFHSDKKYAANLKPLVEQYKLKSEEINRLICLAEKICNTLLEKINGSGKSIELALNDDAKYILEDLKLLRNLRLSKKSYQYYIEGER